MAQPTSGILSYAAGSVLLHALNAANGQQVWMYTAPGYHYFNDGVVVDGTLYATTDAVNAGYVGDVYAFNATTGVVLWQVTPGGPIADSPAVVNGKVYYGADDGKLYALNASDGSIAWTATLGGYMENTPAVVHGVIYVLVGEDIQQLFALKATDGTVLWSAPVPLAYSATTRPVVVGGQVYVTSEGGQTLYAIDAATGVPRWSFALSGYGGEGVVVGP